MTTPGIILACLILLASAGIVPAQDASTERRFTLEVESWITTGAGEWETGGRTLDGTRFRSLLEWDDLDSRLLVVRGSFLVTPGLWLTGGIGGGKIRDGHNMDSDWISGLDLGGRKASESVSRTEGDAAIFELGVEVDPIGLRAEPPKEPPPVDVLIVAGCLVYRDELSDSDGVQTIVLGEEVHEAFPGPNATYDFNWTALRAGVALDFELNERFALGADLMVLFGATHDGEGYWRLREDMKQSSPNLYNEVDNGFGYDLALSLTCRLGERLSLDAGYRAIHLEAEDGDFRIIFADGEVGRIQTHDVSSDRSGFFAGLRGTF